MEECFVHSFLSELRSEIETLFTSGAIAVEPFALKYIAHQ